MAAYQSGLVLNAVLDQIFEDIAEPTTRLNGTIALIGVALLISAFLQAWLHFAGWAHMACRVLMTGNVDDYAILDWIVKKGLLRLDQDRASVGKGAC
ncbi:hypothetical protein CLAFUW4_07222 [Fulvia fulva]|uniref:Uncharacterized protein n=1 Tax=Passalora fulva TaxID=5499 RepID=A0A9Q8UQM3_PASFU|nr:uncharacterized protein CLAFUR5_07355 [Fulvia fulva]KAK4622116.1 hypothetical protein CLAFUR4_07230 [Fulvia fulva]KAK4623185.1 hypothetical protein CLAFUR0_07227 [Fulvia fulva]UJO18835.1 hypothetical protein CLAFUR5_07355 [Fulvia fulva]WPV16138.1 hypothetical protein CLAFUW4_07222 [Fulvia fulva]WPV31683.1 hypothetical protein CLAFUW7_07223 [Fulvia fulva]